MDKSTTKRKRSPSQIAENKQQDRNTLAEQRRVFHQLRLDTTDPETVLENGELAGPYATECLLNSHASRSNKQPP